MPTLWLLVAPNPVFIPSQYRGLHEREVWLLSSIIGLQRRVDRLTEIEMALSSVKVLVLLYLK